MKLFVLGAVICSTFVVASGAVNRASDQLKAEEATKYCNSTYPVTGDPREKLTKVVINGGTIPDANELVNGTDWCHLYCFLEKVGFFDAEGKMQIRDTYHYLLRSHPEIAPNSHYVLVYLFQIRRETKDMEDKCLKAYAAYYKFTEAIMAATLATDLNANPDVKKKAEESILSGDALPKELEAGIEKYFKNVESIFKKTVESSADISSTVAPVPTV